MLITVVSIVFITLALILFSIGKFNGARVLVPIVVVAMGMIFIEGSYDIGANQIEAKQVEENEDKDKTEESSSDVKDKYLKELDALSEKDESQDAWHDEVNKIYDALKDRLSPEQMEAVREEQRQWLNYRESQNQDNRFENKARCYNLVEAYMR